MSDRERPQMSPASALNRAERLAGRVRSAGRWHGWVWVTAAILTPIFLISTRDGGLAHPVQMWIAGGFAAVGLLLAFWERRRGVISRQTARLSRPATIAYVAVLWTVAAVTVVWDPLLTPGYVALALAPSVPCLIVAWRILRR